MINIIIILASLLFLNSCASDTRLVPERVVLSIDISAEGLVEDVRVLSSSPKNKELEQKAVQQAFKYKFKPMINNIGENISKKDHIIQVEFKLKDSKKKKVD